MQYRGVPPHWRLASLQRGWFITEWRFVHRAGTIVTLRGFWMPWFRALDLLWEVHDSMVEGRLIG